MVVKAAEKSTTRYFYTDALAAVWMAKHFGMKLLSETDDGLVDAGARFIDCGDTFRELWQHDFSYLGKLFVHPESLNLLEPQVVDLLRGDEHTLPTIRFMDVPDAEQMGAGTALMRRGFKIIQRKGKAFHWPESEAA